MPQPEASSQPRLAVGCRITVQQESSVLLYPEGALRLQGTALRIMQMCDGVRTFQEIVTALAAEYVVDANRIHAEASKFLERLHAKRIVDYSCSPDPSPSSPN